MFTSNIDELPMFYESHIYLYININIYMIYTCVCMYIFFVAITCYNTLRSLCVVMKVCVCVCADVHATLYRW